MTEIDYTTIALVSVVASSVGALVTEITKYFISKWKENHGSLLSRIKVTMDRLNTLLTEEQLEEEKGK